VYGSSSYPTFTASYNGFVNRDTPSSLGGALVFKTDAVNSPAGDYPLTVAGLTSTNYAITFVDGKMTINPAALIVTPSNASRVYGQANPVFKVTYSGFVNGDTPRALVGTLTFITLADAATPAGPYAVTPAGLISRNYSIYFGNGTLTVTPAPLTVTAINETK